MSMWNNKEQGLMCIEAQVSSTVAGFATTIVVSGSPYTVHSFLSNSSHKHIKKIYIPQH